VQKPTRKENAVVRMREVIRLFPSSAAHLRRILIDMLGNCWVTMNCEQSLHLSYGEIVEVAMAALNRCPNQGSIALSGKPLVEPA
jgi:hypothetical protein